MTKCKFLKISFNQYPHPYIHTGTFHFNHILLPKIISVNHVFLLFCFGGQIIYSFIYRRPTMFQKLFSKLKYTNQQIESKNSCVHLSLYEFNRKI